MGLGTRWMLRVAEWVAGLGGAVVALPLPPAPVIPLMCFGATLAVLCWRQGLTARRPSLMGGGFLAGMAMLAASTAIWLTASRPLLLIADEPTSALDVTVQLEVLGILDRLVRERGMGLIFVSHDLRLVSSFCDRVLVMYAGRVVEELASGDLASAQHPYTRGLIAAMPDPRNPVRRLKVLDRQAIDAEVMR